MPAATVTALAERPPIGALSLEACVWLAEAAARADALCNDRQIIWIALQPHQFVVRGTRRDKTAIRTVPLDQAAAMDANLLDAAVLAVDRELTPRLQPRGLGWRGARRPRHVSGSF